MIDWRNGRPTARFWVLKLLKDNFGPGDRLVETDYSDRDGDIMGRADVSVQGFVTRAGRKLLVVNRRNRPLVLPLPAELGAPDLSVVDEATGEGPPRQARGTAARLELAPFAVAVVTWGPAPRP